MKKMEPKDEGESQTENTPAAITAEDIDRKFGAFAAKQKAAIGKHQEALTAALAGALAPIMERLEAFGKPAAADGKTDQGDASEAIKQMHAKHEAQIKALQQQLEKSESEKAAERATRQTQEERTELTQALSAAGVPVGKIKAAVALLYTEEKRVGRSEDGKVGLKVTRDGYTDVVAMDVGLAEWFKTDDGKEFLPPRGAAGSGASGVNGTRKPGVLMTKAEKIAEADQIIYDYFKNNR
jgi:hypothetical protein